MIEKLQSRHVEVHRRLERTKDSHLATLFVVGVGLNRIVICMEHTEEDNQAVVVYGHKFINDVIDNDETEGEGILRCINFLREGFGKPPLSSQESNNLYIRSRTLREGDILPDYSDDELRKWII